MFIRVINHCSMKQFYLFILLICSILNMSAEDVVFSINGDSMSLKTEYVKDLYVANDESHDANAYVLNNKMNIKTQAGTYEILGYRHLNEEDYNLYGDVFFCRLTVNYYSHLQDDNTCDMLNGTPEKVFIFDNDNHWFKFNYWGFANYTDKPWRDSTDVMCHVVKLSEECHAIILRGVRDSVSPPELMVFVLYKGDVRLVYNQDVEINEIHNEGNEMILKIQKVDYDSAGNMIPTLSNMTFGNNKIWITEESD